MSHAKYCKAAEQKAQRIEKQGSKYHCQLYSGRSQDRGRPLGTTSEVFQGWKAAEVGWWVKGTEAKVTSKVPEDGKLTLVSLVGAN
jgi:hypothetical protein